MAQLVNIGGLAGFSGVLGFKSLQKFRVEDSEFCKRWCVIMNKASLDLILLVVEYTQKELR